MPSLKEVLLALDEHQPADFVIYAAQPWTADSSATVASWDAPPRNLAYLLEVELARDVLRVWSAWRDGASPGVLERCPAIIHYAEHDAYLPT
ncbi:hypothetical protein ACTWQF_18205 [Streptomyces sp. 8N114]|uniref:hypothetical protein n=1 Tax=Streptomyces sp. 8N114 TaxID=3457419 RepID=UPI003FD6292E